MDLPDIRPTRRLARLDKSGRFTLIPKISSDKYHLPQTLNRSTIPNQKREQCLNVGASMAVSVSSICSQISDLPP